MLITPFDNILFFKTTWLGIARSTQHFFLMAAYLSPLLLEQMNNIKSETIQKNFFLLLNKGLKKD